MTTQQKLTKRQKEVAEMMRNGWNLQVRVSSTKGGKHKPLLIYYDGQHSYQAIKVSFSVIDALQKAHIIRPIKSIDYTYPHCQDHRLTKISKTFD